MHQYELMVILDPEIDERTVAPSLDKFLNVVRNDGGTVDSGDCPASPDRHFPRALHRHGPDGRFWEMTPPPVFKSAPT